MLRLSLVSCPVALYKATSRANDISFNLLNPKTNNRIRMVPTDPETGPVDRADLVRGYEVEKNRYVIIQDEELDAVKLETTHTLDIERFVDADSTIRLSDVHIRPMEIRRNVRWPSAVLMRRNLTASPLGRVVMHTRERLMAMEPREKGLLVFSLRMRDEVVNLQKALESIPDMKSDRQMVEIAEKIIAQLEGPFDPEEFRDRYEESLRDLIQRKEKGEKPTVTALPAEPSNVIDLMAALKKSLGAKVAPPKATPPKHATAPAKPPKKRAR